MYPLIVVEDEPILLNGLAKLVERTTFEFQVAGKAGDAFEAMELITTLAPVLVITDIRMPKMDGFALSEFFRYSIHNDEIMVTLRDELAQVERYFIIQRIRYGERISLEIDIDQSLLNQPLVKLTLQPIVENACIHGLESTGIGKIRIHSEIQAEKWRIFITDTGIGISETDLLKIKSVLENPEEAEEAGSQFGIGLRNVQARLRLHYGPEYGLEIDSKEGAGTTVILNIPFATEISSS